MSKTFKEVEQLCCPLLITLLAGCMENGTAYTIDLAADVQIVPPSHPPELSDLPAEVDGFTGLATATGTAFPGARITVLEDGNEVADEYVTTREMATLGTWSTAPGEHTYAVTLGELDENVEATDLPDESYTWASTPTATASFDAAVLVNGDAVPTPICVFTSDGFEVGTKAADGMVGLSGVADDGAGGLVVDGDRVRVEAVCDLYLADEDGGALWMTARPEASADADYGLTLSMTAPNEIRVGSSGQATVAVAYAGTQPVSLVFTVNGEEQEGVEVAGNTSYPLDLSGFAAAVGADGELAITAQATTALGLASDLVEATVAVGGIYAPGLGISPNQSTASVSLDCDLGLGDLDRDGYLQLLATMRRPEAAQAGTLLTMGAPGRDALTVAYEASGELVVTAVLPTATESSAPYSVRAQWPADEHLHQVSVAIEPSSGIVLALDGLVKDQLVVENLSVAGLGGYTPTLLDGMVAWHLASLGAVRAPLLAPEDVEVDICAGLAEHAAAMCFDFEELEEGIVTTGTMLDASVTALGSCTATASGAFTVSVSAE